MEIKKTAVIGAGTMGSSIAVALAGAGLKVVLKDVNDSFLQAGLQRIDRFLQSKVKKGLSQADADAQRALIEPSTTFDGFNNVDLVIEAASEAIDIKRAVFSDLDRVCRPDAILGTNTSSLPITQIAAFTSSPQRVVGLHFFNPAHLMKLVEVIPGLETDEAVVKAAMDFVVSLGKLAVRVEECPSFLVNRLLGRYMNEALWCLQEGADIEELDKAVCDYVMPVGPFALRDMNGADIGLAVARFNYSEYGERFAPPPVLQKMVESNLLGQKTGAGFYMYDAESKKRTHANPAIAELVAPGGAVAVGTKFDVRRLFLPMINEAFLVLQERICAHEDLDKALMAGLGMRKGPLALADDIGLATCLEMIEELYQKHGERFRPAPLMKRFVFAGRRASV